jgi:phage terminase large subunit GpA-like protein
LIDVDRPCLDAFAAEIEPPPLRTADAWADACRALPPESPEPGPWRTSRVPYTRAICAAFADPAIDSVVVVMGSQMAKTETILNLIGHWFDDGPLLPTLYVGPTQKQVSSISGDRFTKMLQSTPRLRDRLAGGHADKIAEKWIAGVRLGFAWAGSATELSSHPNARVLVDECDRMDDDVNGEGDPVEIANARRDAYQDSKLGVFSTPTLEGASRVWSRFEEGSMLKWAWPCDHCRTLFVPSMQLLKFDPDAPLTTIAHNARVMCPYCAGEHEDVRRAALNARGDYLPHRLTATGEHELTDAPIANRVASFWISGLASPFVSFGASAERLARALRSREQERIQGVVNTRFGEVFKARGDAPKWEELRALVRPVAPLQVPEWGQILTMGTDVQRDGLYYVIRAWGYDPVIQSDRSHLVDFGHLHGDPDFDDVWLALRALTFAEYHSANDLRIAPRVLSITAGLVDSGFNPSRDRFKRPEHRVYEWCRRMGWRQQPSKGHDAQMEPVKMSRIDRTPTGRAIPGGLKLWHVDTDHFKTWLHAEIRRSVEDDDPTWSLNSAADENYMRQITSEELVIKPGGRRIWTVPKSRANHLLDCEVLARAAAYIHRAKWAGQFHAVRGEETDAPREAAPAAPAASAGYFRRPQGSYIRR